MEELKEIEYKEIRKTSVMKETIKHRKYVRDAIDIFCRVLESRAVGKSEDEGNRIAEITQELIQRGVVHDQSKLEDPELEIFEKYTSTLRTLEYGSDKYMLILAEMQPALEHHYKVNRHHPEHFENGIDGMSELDLVEMLCDWFAAVKRNLNGDIFESISINRKRFNYSEAMEFVLRSTALGLGGAYFLKSETGIEIAKVSTCTLYDLIEGTLTLEDLRNKETTAEEIIMKCSNYNEKDKAKEEKVVVKEEKAPRKRITELEGIIIDSTTNK